MMNVNLHKFEVTNLWSLNNGSYSLTLTDDRGASVVLYFESLHAVRDFSRLVSLMTEREDEKNWSTFDRPTLITD